ncbi:DNA repair protein RadA [Candidatus Woesebacteria bacterium RIFOXYB1_FULL_40_26]|uniref:DNA repair protein RadA n=1 Tax=Candidatus Woesebacteria bacterium RIFOXYB1_FULL_40_26 TaxID=1802539 RepID=A0A1F8CY43_9BACT|nr:MAG: DNA repair protein RadA [Candidatus Woesebacteria bacterium RIFOXYB1_FULL_40_26]
MAKPHSQYICQQCGYSQVGWAGKCPNCGSWGSLVETVISPSLSLRKNKNGKSISQSTSKPISLSSISSKKTARITTSISELDRVLGGGLVAGQVVLIAGEPGIGKSTLLLQLSDMLAASYKPSTRAQAEGLPATVLYVCGEESASQIAVRAQRLGIRNKSIQLLEETDVDSVTETIDTFKGQSLQGIVVDSIQTMTTSDLSGMAGSVGQVRECTFRLTNLAKKINVPLFIVGHVTKEGTVAGPAVLAHIVDTVLWFEGDKSLTLRILRAVKNRFGPTDEVGIFEMEDKGLICLSDPEKVFITHLRKEVAGKVVSCIQEGTRPILVEIQSLIVPTKLAFPRRIAQGIDSKRFELLLAVLTRRCGLPLYEYDVFVNVTGGISVREPSCDLAVCLSVASSFLDKPLRSDSVVVGEVGLLGEIREVVGEEKRIKESKRLGFKNPITHKEVKYVSEAIKRYIK